MSDYPGKYTKDDTESLRSIIKEDATTIAQQRKDLELLAEVVLETLNHAPFGGKVYEACQLARKIKENKLLKQLKSKLAAIAHIGTQTL